MIHLKKINLNYTELFLCMLWGNKLMSYITAVCLRLPGLNLVARGVVPFILVIVFLLAHKEFFRRIKTSDTFFYFVCASIFLFTYILFPENSSYLDETISPFLLSALPFVFVGRAFNMEKLAEPFYLISMLCVIIEGINVLVFEVAERAMSEYQYDMHSAYVLLPHVLMVLWHFMKKINIIDLAVVLLGLFLMMGYGTRGAVLCVVVFAGLYFLFGIEGRKKWWYYLFVVAAASVAIYTLNSLLEVLDIGIQQVGLSTRIINAYEQDMLDDDSGRGIVHSQIKNALSTSNVFGLGVCGDRVATGGQYSHNIVYEFLASFGYILGPFLLVVLALFIYKAFRSCSSSDERGFLLLLIGEAFHLLLSDSFLQNSHFFILIGFSAKLIYDGRIRRESIRISNVKSNSISKVLS